MKSPVSGEKYAVESDHDEDCDQQGTVLLRYRHD
jgi:hypothetical protein